MPARANRRHKDADREVDEASALSWLSEADSGCVSSTGVVAIESLEYHHLLSQTKCSEK